ncbi:MAG: TIGR01212 family radical SAM protein [Ruminococcus sp.]|nr:TIGR01212 family radical SAM protein [Ruminococcus sp.]
MKDNPFVYSSDNKRYHTLSYYNKNKYGGKVYKAVLDCGFTCPNIDGKKGHGGCIFCDSGSGYFTKGNLDIRSQLNAEIERISCKSSGEIRVIAYFQANTNTYAPVDQLRRLYETVLENEHVCGISIGTRADCLSEDVLDLLTELNGKTNLTVELGLQSVHDETINYINRCCTHAEFLDGYNRLKSTGIRTCLHIINGLPQETPEMMIETARQASLMKPDAVKIQMLHIINGTPLAKIYESSSFKPLTKDEYIDIVVRQLELFSPEAVIERITGDGDKSKLIAPLWTTDKISVLGGIDKLQACRGSWQGKKYVEK